MSEKNDGGPAFPLPLDPTGRAHWKEGGGITTRDYFAAKAMQGALADPQVDPSGKDGRERLARQCYLMADAMLAERAKER